MRPDNAIDFWRGLALVSIFINHIPGFAFERVTYRNYGLSDSAELFVFLAGWALRLISTNAHEPLGLPRLVLRLAARAVTLYAAQILITTVAIGIISLAVITLDNPLLLEWNNAAAVYQDPVPTHLGLVLLTHQLGYFDILPLYVVLMAGAPLIAVVHRLAPAAVLPISLAIYAATLTFELNLPTWPVEGVWFFDPFAWQLVFVLGFLFAGDGPIGRWVRRALPVVRPIAWVVLVGSAAIVLNDIQPDPTRMPDPKLFFIFDKTFMSPARLLHFLALVAAFAGVFRYIARWIPPLASFLSMLGRNSLNVFCVGSILSLGGQVVRVARDGGLSVDIAVLIIGIAALGVTAWLSELRDRLRRPLAPSPLPSA